jgi:preprotein translocase subunit YajC
MSKYSIILIVLTITAIFFFFYLRVKKNKIRELKKDSRTGTFTDI